MKICYLANSWLPSRYANAVHVVNMAQALSQTNADVTLLAFRGDESLLPSSDERALYQFYGVEPSFEIEWLPNPSVRGRSLLASLAAWSRLKNLAPDLVIGRHVKACAAACFRGIPTVLETHKPFSWHSRGERLLIRRLIDSASFRGLVTISNPLRDILAEEMGLDSSRILVAHDAATPSNVESPVQMGTSDRLQAGYVGTFFQGRGIELIFEIAAALPEMDFHFIGGSAEELSILGIENPRLSNIHFHGFQTPSQAAAMRAGCDVLLAPYQRKTLIKDGWDTTKWMSPLKIFEYMSATKPILCSDLPVLREVMVNEGNALLLPPDESSAWVSALKRLEGDPVSARALGQRAFDDFMQNHTWEQRAKRIVAFAGAGR